MEHFYKAIFYLSGFIMFWAMIGYPISVRILGIIYRNRQLKKDYTLQPTVTVRVVAHNEEKVILDRLNNLMMLNYPKEKNRIYNCF